MNEHDSETAVTLPEAAAASEPAGSVMAAGSASSVRGRSPSQILRLKLRRNRTAMAGLYTLAAMYAAANIGGVHCALQV